MQFIQHPSNTQILGAPPGWDQATLPVDALPVTVHVQDNVPVITSFWQPNAEELAALNAGKPVMLNIIGQRMPPVSVGVEALEVPHG